MARVTELSFEPLTPNKTLTHQLKLSPKTCMKWFPRKAEKKKSAGALPRATATYDSQACLRAG